MAINNYFMKYIVANLILMSILRLSCAGQNSTQVKSYVIKSIDSTKNYYFITAICSTESRDSLLIISAKPSSAEKIKDRIMTKRAYKFILKSYLSKEFNTHTHTQQPKFKSLCSKTTKSAKKPQTKLIEETK